MKKKIALGLIIAMLGCMTLHADDNGGGNQILLYAGLAALLIVPVAIFVFLKSNRANAGTAMGEFDTGVQPVPASAFNNTVLHHLNFGVGEDKVYLGVRFDIGK